MSATNRHKTDRQPKDRYPTPLYTLEPLFERIDLGKVKTFLEPCKGDGRIIDKFIPDHIDVSWCEIEEGKDYFEHTFENIDLIVTNPPFSISMPFIIKSLTEAKTVCYLQRLNWLGSQKRRDFWNNNIPDKLFVLENRPHFLKELGLKGGTDATEYGWFIWDGLGIVEGKHIEVI